MINKELDEIMIEYVKKAGKFCEKYEKEVSEKHYGTFSHAIEEVLGGLEDGLWELKANTEELLYIAHDRFISRIKTNEIVASINLANKEVDGVHYDLVKMHNYFMNRTASNIAESLASQWAIEAQANVCLISH